VTPSTRATKATKATKATMTRRTSHFAESPNRRIFPDICLWTTSADERVAGRMN
jgi:hypothetical protein